MTMARANNWPTVRLEEVCEYITVGHVGPMADQYLESGIPFLRSQNVRPFRFDPSELKFISRTFHSKLKKSALRPNDVVVTRSGANTGQCCIIPPRLVEANCSDLVIIRHSEKINPWFLMYLLNSDWGRAIIAGGVVGAAQHHFNIGTAKLFTIQLPPIEIQQRIAGILSAYDDLIENSQRRIKILESMARALYREWFVNFRFPGHEGHLLVASPLGEIPKGWEVKKLRDVCRLTMGQSPKSEFYNEVGDGLPFHQGVTNFGDRFPTDRLFCTAEGRIAEAGDILFSVRAPVGRMNIANKKIILGRGLSAIRYLRGSQAFLWEQLRNRFTKDDMMGNGAIFAAVTKGDMQGIELVCPPLSVVEAATKHFEPLHAEIATLSMQIQNLLRTRGLLLPRLLSGQINVEVA